MGGGGGQAVGTALTNRGISLTRGRTGVAPGNRARANRILSRGGPNLQRWAVNAAGQFVTRRGR